MNKKFKLILLVFYALGFLMYSLSRIFANCLSEFALGFLEGISTIFIISGFICIVWSLIKNKHKW